MGMNYYWHDPVSPRENRGNVLHVGKSSAGWCFGLHVYPEHGINTLDDWVGLFSFPGSWIEDECGDRVSVEDMLTKITDRSWPGFPERLLDEEWLRVNHAVHGPNGLARCELSRYCVGHGEGTWDYIAWDFS